MENGKDWSKKGWRYNGVLDDIHFLRRDTNEKTSLEGGLIKRQHPQQPNLNYISIPSIDEYSSKVKELGGKVVLPKTEITGYGFFAVCMDTENNAFALWESKK